jgi:subtilisin-like proprotein convertase family protein
VDVPNDALYLTNVVIFANQTGNGPVGIYMTNTDNVTMGDYGVEVSPPGGYLVLGPTNNPPLSGGTWYYELYNYGATPVTLTNYIFFLTSLTPNLVESFSNSAATPLTTDATTSSQICITNGQQVVDLQVGLRIADANLDDLAIHLVSPQGTSVLLFENRGGLLASNLGLSLSSTNSTNFVYTVFTEDTNLTTTPIKFAPPPYAVQGNTELTTNVLTTFEDATNVQIFEVTDTPYLPIVEVEWITNKTCTQGQLVSGWTVASNEVNVVTDTNLAYSGSNFLALPNARITRTFPTVPGATYEFRYQARGPGIAHWWPSDRNTDDIINTNACVLMNGATYAAGLAGQAFWLNGSNQYVSVPGSSNLDFSSYTWELWVNFADYPTNDDGDFAQCLIDKIGSTNGWFTTYFLGVGSGVLVGEISNPQNVPYIPSYGWDPINGTWHHLAFAYDRAASFQALCVDGAETSGSGSVTGPIDYDDSFPLLFGVYFRDQIGYAPTNLQWFFNGLMDEITLYSRALSPGEVLSICQAQGRGKYSTNSLLPNFQVTIDGYSTNTVILADFGGDWQPFTNSFVATNTAVTIELAGNTLSTLLDDLELVQLPSTNYGSYFLPEEPLTPFFGENSQGCWTLQVWDTRNDSPLPTNGALLSWNLQMTVSSTNAHLIVLTNGVPYIGSAASGITYFAVDVPAAAHFATNILAVLGPSPMNLLFNQAGLPLGTLPGDVKLLSGVSAGTGPETATLAAQGAPPPLLPGQRYFLGVQNTNAGNAPFSLKAQFDQANVQITPLTNSVPVTAAIGPAPATPQYYSFVVPGDAAFVTFQILNPSNPQSYAKLGLYARNSLPVPGPLNFDYESAIGSDDSDQFIVVTTNSVPVLLPGGNLNEVLPPGPTTWYLAVDNFADAGDTSYTIVATWASSNQITVIPLSDGVPYRNTAAPGFPTLFYSFAVTNLPAGVEFVVTNLSDSGNVELLANGRGLPTPESFYSGSFKAGTAAHFISIGTNGAWPTV